MSSNIKGRRVLATAVAAVFLLCQGAAFAQPDADAQCGGDHEKGKEVKKPKDEGDKRPNPAAADPLCGGDHEKGKEVKKPEKPKDEGDKRPNPA
jgi:hypothetical protein